ncbi:hypothetical protein ACF1AY_18740 [Streptomyces sp. NPDC014776]|uniref:hypothetical protein n=1 Tax=Streptomyces sp. NPDC014776 TaxID=3364909 RepID=UPI0036F6EE02
MFTARPNQRKAVDAALTQLASGTRATMVSPCTGKKQTMPAPTGEMYLGSYHCSDALLAAAA